MHAPPACSHGLHLQCMATVTVSSSRCQRRTALPSASAKQVHKAESDPGSFHETVASLNTLSAMGPGMVPPLGRRKLLRNARSRFLGKRGVPWSQHHAAVLQEVRDRQLIPPGSRVLVAVSGGQDSMCLLQLLLDMRHLLDLQLVVAHCDHQTRDDSAATAAFVQQAAARLGLPCCLRVAQDGEDLSKEAVARPWRYQQLHDLARENGCNTIVTGHTATDRAETLLFNTLRGAGLDGLGALRWVVGGEVPVVRPLLGLTRQQTAEVCEWAGLQVYEDITNKDLKYSRNRIRLELLPLLQLLNSQAVAHLAVLAELAAGEVSFLEQIARFELNSLVLTSWGVLKSFWVSQGAPLDCSLEQLVRWNQKLQPFPSVQEQLQQQEKPCASLQQEGDRTERLCRAVPQALNPQHIPWQTASTMMSLSSLYSARGSHSSSSNSRNSRGSSSTDCYLQEICLASLRPEAAAAAGGHAPSYPCEQPQGGRAPEPVMQRARPCVPVISAYTMEGLASACIGTAARAEAANPLHSIALPVPELQALHPALLGRVLRLWLRETLHVGLSYRQLKSCEKLLWDDVPEESRSDSLVRGVTVVKRGGRLLLDGVQ